MKFAIRDDDTCFFTSPEDLQEAYDFVLDGCISLSIVPKTVPMHKNNFYPYGNFKFGYYSLSDNSKLVAYLKEKINERKYEVLLHGYSHEYKCVDGNWKAEMIWKEKSQIEEELKMGKQFLEGILSTSINIFVAPNNAISKKTIDVLEKLGLDYSGIIQHKDRRVTVKYLKNYILRWGYRAAYGIQYGGVLDYGGHLELNAYALDSVKRLKFEYEKCKEKGHPFVIYTHYWSLLNNTVTKKCLKEIYEYVMNDGAQLVPLSECYKLYENQYEQ